MANDAREPFIIIMCYRSRDSARRSALFVEPDAAENALHPNRGMNLHILDVPYTMTTSTDASDRNLATVYMCRQGVRLTFGR